MFPIPILWAMVPVLAKRSFLVLIEQLNQIIGLSEVNSLSPVILNIEIVLNVEKNLLPILN